MTPHIPMGGLSGGRAHAFKTKLVPDCLLIAYSLNLLWEIEWDLSYRVLHKNMQLYFENVVCHTL